MQSHSIKRLHYKVTAFSSYIAKSQHSAVTLQSHSIQWLHYKVTPFSGYIAKSQHSAVTLQSHSIKQLHCIVTAFSGYTAKSQHSVVTLQSHSSHSAKSQHSAVTLQSHSSQWLSHEKSKVYICHWVQKHNTFHQKYQLARPASADIAQHDAWLWRAPSAKHKYMPTILTWWPIRSKKTIPHYCNITGTNTLQYSSTVLQKSMKKIVKNTCSSWIKIDQLMSLALFFCSTCFKC